MSKSQYRQQGFTLLELLVVLLIIGLLAGFVGPKYFGQIGRSEQQLVKAQIDAFDKALDQYRVDTGSYPTTAEGLAALFAKPADAAKWRGPYLKKAVPVDPWGKAYVYNSPGSNDREFEIISYGKDGVAGGSDDNADVTSY
ncbi:type II secretion system protein GspG [Chitinimonas prasina]|uniref:Type II secretion system core protein G n=1 Tax=Chitinimonas prasina TaxID=1434937 RepID=A0ABQ5YJ30_9NEIS|nr:type II secretion system major pseudopilin GspG [Chitinimonas prasina]GLR13673.1 type II secretion system protein GspG [Chitinimonas prasina]